MNNHQFICLFFFKKYGFKSLLMNVFIHGILITGTVEVWFLWMHLFRWSAFIYSKNNYFLMITACVSDIKIKENVWFRNLLQILKWIAKIWREIKIIQLNSMAMCPSNSIETWRISQNSNKFSYSKQRED